MARTTNTLHCFLSVLQRHDNNKQIIHLQRNKQTSQFLNKFQCLSPVCLYPCTPPNCFLWRGRCDWAAVRPTPSRRCHRKKPLVTRPRRPARRGGPLPAAVGPSARGSLAGVFGHRCRQQRCITPQLTLTVAHFLLGHSVAQECTGQLYQT